MAKVNEPNLFHWATSELSQDAFICWLLSWANHKEMGDPIVYETAMYFINELTGTRIPDIQNVEVIRQYKNIDILCKVNDEYAILIEDKIHTKNHTDQLERYYSSLTKEFTKDKIIPVYLKTGDQGDYNSIKKAGYKLFLRKDFLKVLEFGIGKGVTNSIFNDFYRHLNRIELSVQSYKELPVVDWHWDSWKGFYIELNKRLTDGNWDYVPQKNGGFLGFWWCWQYKEYNDVGFDYYLQLEHNKFCFKLYPYEREKAEEIRVYYRKMLYEKAKELNISIYQNGRIGNYMTVAALTEPYLKIDEKGFLDIESTVEVLKGIEKLITEI